jgi:hypothetical protein
MTTFLYRTLDAALEPVVTLVGAVISVYVTLLLHKLTQKTGLQVSAEQELKVRVAFQNAILAAEEGARQRLKTTGTPTAGAEKRAEVTAEMQARFPQKDATEVAKLINEELPKVRAALAPAIAPPVVAPLIIPTPPSLES